MLTDEATRSGKLSQSHQLPLFLVIGAGPGGAAAGASALLGLGPQWKRGCVTPQDCNEMNNQAQILLNYITLLNKSLGKRSVIPNIPQGTIYTVMFCNFIWLIYLQLF